MKKTIFFLTVLIPLYSQSSGIGCQDYNIFKPRDLSVNDILDLEADSSSIESKNIYNLSGNATLVSPEYAIKADKITLNKQLDLARSSGNIEFNDDIFSLTTSELSIEKSKNNENLLRTSKALFSIPNQRIRGKAEQISGTSNYKILNNAEYTKCPQGNSDWLISADQIRLNSLTNRGQADNATLKLLNLPIFYTPSIEWVLSGRGSGFLAPSYSSYQDTNSSKKGFSIEVPYYINIAADRDLLIGWKHLTTRGESLKFKYRQLLFNRELLKENGVVTDIRFLSRDKITNEDRWYFDNELNFEINDNTNIEIVNKRVSDKNYFKEIELEGTDTERLISYGHLRFYDADKQLRASLYSENEQVVNLGNFDYTKKSELNLDKNLLINNFINLNLNSTSTIFDHKNSLNNSVSRNDIKFKFSKNFGDLSYSTTPSLTLRNTYYDADGVNTNRFIYNLNIDSKAFFERNVDIDSNSYKQTLIPSINYSYIPKKDQSGIGNYDTESKNINNYESIFLTNEFIGSDKISNQNNFIFSLESEFINNNSGDTLLTLKAAQKFYLDDELLNSTGTFSQTDHTQRGFSDIQTFIEFEKFPLSYVNSLSIDPKAGNINGTNSTLKYSFNSENFINLSHIDYDNKEHVGLSGVIPMNQDLHLFFNINRNLTDNLTDRFSLGLANENCCLAYRFGFFKKHENNFKYSYDRVFEIVFKGLSTTTPSLRNRIEAEIPDYIADLDNL